MFEGDSRALARAISAVEEGGAAARPILEAAYRRAGKATVIGITGPPGVGKSTLVNGLITVYRRRKQRVAVLAVDPSSAFSGGAILGDRIRMQEHALDPGVFIRSMATRGHSGGVARATADAMDLADAAGWNPILIETLGAGQDEIEVAMLAEPVLVVLMPGLGDDIQAIKAGLIEIADLFVINKADLEGAERLERDLRNSASLAQESSSHGTSILRTVAHRGEGLEEVVEAIESFHQNETGERRKRRRERCEARLIANLQDRFLRELRARTGDDGDWRKIIEDLVERKIDPYTAVDRVLEGIRGIDNATPGRTIRRKGGESK